MARRKTRCLDAVSRFELEERLEELYFADELSRLGLRRALVVPSLVIAGLCFAGMCLLAEARKDDALTLGGVLLGADGLLVALALLYLGFVLRASLRVRAEIRKVERQLGVGAEP